MDPANTHTIPEQMRSLWRALGLREGPRLDLDSLDTPGVDDEHAPIFLLATGWRTGSTLLQRILMTDRRLLLWGEPVGRLGLLSRLTTVVAGIRDGYPNPAHIIDTLPGDFATSWVANLYPPMETLRAGLRELLIQWLAVPAMERGFERWGLKEVRLGSREAVFLSWLFPKAKFIVLSRHPFDLFCSMRHSNLWVHWPEWPVSGSYSAVVQWQRLVSSWTDSPVSHLMLRYEDLIEPGFDYCAIERWAGLALTPDTALTRRVGDQPRRRRPTWWQRFIIQRLARDGMNALRY